MNLAEAALLLLVTQIHPGRAELAETHGIIQRWPLATVKPQLRSSGNSWQGCSVEKG